MGLAARWRALPQSQRLLLAVGAPVVAAAALWRRRTSPQPTGPASTSTRPTGTQSTARIDPGAVGVAASASDFGQFANVWSDNLGAVQSRLTQVEADLAQTQAAGPPADTSGYSPAMVRSLGAVLANPPADVSPGTVRSFRDALARRGG